MRYVFIVLNPSGNSVHRVYADGKKMQRYIDAQRAKGIIYSWYLWEISNGAR